jgi:hypothetical protein
MTVTETTVHDVGLIREGVTSKQIRKPENLPEWLIVLLARMRADQ